MARRVLKGDNLRASGLAIGVFGIVVLLSEGSPALGMVALALAVVLYAIGGLRA